MFGSSIPFPKLLLRTGAPSTQNIACGLTTLSAMTTQCPRLLKTLLDHRLFSAWAAAFFSRSANNFLKSSRSRSGSRSVSFAVCYALFQPAFTAFWSNSIARSAYSFFLSAILVLANE